MGIAGNWFQRDPSDEDIKRVQRKMSGGNQQRFWLKAEESRKVIFLDDEPFCFYEHNPVINGEFWHYFTCRKGVDPSDPICPLCQSGNKSSYMGYVTVLDATGWEYTKGDRKGERVLYSRRLFPMTLKSIKKFKSKKQRRTSLVGALFTLTRTSKDEVRVGDDWELEKVVDPFADEKYWFDSKAQGKKLPPEPFKYEEIFAPLSKVDMLNLNLTSGNDDGYKSGSDGGGDEDELY